MSDALFDLSDLVRLEGDLGKVAPAAILGIRAATQKSASRLRDEWKSNATVTAGRHGKLYPSTITYETKVSTSGVSATVGPDSSMPQGGMGKGFEYGSVNQPPHMDGNRATDAEEPRYVADIKVVVTEALGGLGG